MMFVKDIDVKRDDADLLDWRDLDGCQLEGEKREEPWNS